LINDEEKHKICKRNSFENYWEKSYSVKLGHGSFLTIELGNSIKVKVKTNKPSDFYERGEWSLWVYMCSWRIDQNNKPFIACNDSREKIEKKIKQLKNRKIIDTLVLNSSLDTSIQFEGDIVLRLFPSYTIDEEHWMLFTPDHQVLTAGPKSELFYESES